MPLRGQRLEYIIPQIASDYRILVKESIGSWLGLTPQYPLYGTFGGKGTNAKSTYTKRAGFRFISYKFLLVPGTSITQPGKGTSTTTSKVKVATISIGFPRGHKGEHTSVHSIIEFAKKCSQASAIMGIVSPTGRKYQWKGKLSGSTAGSGSGGSGGSGGLGGLLGDAASAAGGLLGDAEGAAASAAGASPGIAGLLGDAASGAAGLLF